MDDLMTTTRSRRPSPSRTPVRDPRHGRTGAGEPGVARVRDGVTSRAVRAAPLAPRWVCCPCTPKGEGDVGVYGRRRFLRARDSPAGAKRRLSCSFSGPPAAPRLAPAVMEPLLEIAARPRRRSAPVTAGRVEGRGPPLPGCGRVSPGEGTRSPQGRLRGRVLPAGPGAPSPQGREGVSGPGREAPHGAA